MSGIAMMEKPNNQSSVFSKRRGRLLIASACLMAIIAGTLLFRGDGNGLEPPPPGMARTGSDAVDLKLKHDTGFSVSGTVTINRQIPLFTGYVVAYERSKSHALACSPLDSAGNYRLTGVPPGELLLLVKREITNETNQVIRESFDARGIHLPEDKKGKSGPKAGAPMKRSRTGDAPEAAPGAKLFAKQPSKEALSKIRFDVCTPGYDSLPEVQWMVNAAFMKYGSFSDRHRFVVPAEEGERVYVFDLPVP